MKEMREGKKTFLRCSLCLLIFVFYYLSFPSGFLKRKKFSSCSPKFTFHPQKQCHFWILLKLSNSLCFFAFSTSLATKGLLPLTGVVFQDESIPFERCSFHRNISNSVTPKGNFSPYVVHPCCSGIAKRVQE